MAPYLRGSRFVLMGEDAIKYLLRDEFITSLAAGAVNGTAAEPGPGVRTVVDSLGTKLSISSGSLVLIYNAVGDPGLWSTAAFVRTPGYVLLSKFTIPTSSNIRLGWATAKSGAIVNNDFNPSSASTLLKVGLNSTSTQVGSYTANTPYNVAIPLRAGGCFYFIKGGSEYPVWVLVMSASLDTTSPLYPGITVSGATASAQSDFLRIPTALWLPTPLLSTSGAMTWPTTNGLGHLETTGLGAGGSGLTMLDAGTWSVAGGYVLNTPAAGVEKIVNGGFADGSAWSLGTDWSIGSGVATKAAGATINHCTQSVLANVSAWYKCTFDLVSISADSVPCFFGNSLTGPLRATPGTYFQTSRTMGSFAIAGIRGSAAFAGSVDNVSYLPLPISNLITNVPLSTTDVLAEEVIHARTAGTQVGMAMNLDRSFAAKAAALASAGQAVLSLKEVTGVGGVGLAATDGLTVNGVSYTLTVTGAGTVAYDDVAKTQTVVLGANLGADVAADAKVGLDWASWNGVVGPYFDGAGNVKVDEVVAGVYVNRLSAAVTFVADKRLIARKIGSSYYVFFNETLVGTTALVNAAAMAGKYHGMFSTLAANTITSMVIYDTGNVTNLYSNLDKYSC